MLRIRKIGTREYVSLRQLHILFKSTGAEADPSRFIRGPWDNPQSPTKAELNSIGYEYEPSEDMSKVRAEVLTEAARDMKNKPGWLSRLFKRKQSSG